MRSAKKRKKASSRQAFAHHAAIRVPAREPDKRQPERHPVNRAERTLVNYVWVHARPDNRYGDGPLCTVPSAHVEMAIKNANKYPKAHFNIWVDSKLTGASTLFWLNSYIYAQAQHKNVRVRDLQKIARYAEDAFFVPPTQKKKKHQRSMPKSPYLRADYARIVVLEHCLKTPSEHRFIVYTDFDCPDVKLGQTVQRLRENGVVLHDIGWRQTTSNGYIALDKTNSKVHGAFDELVTRTRDDVVRCELGYTALQRYVETIHRDFSRDRSRLMMPLLPNMYTKARPSRFMASLGLE